MTATANSPAAGSLGSKKNSALSIDALLSAGRAQLTAAPDSGVRESAALDAALLLGHCLGVRREYLIAHGTDLLSAPEQVQAAEEYSRLVQHRERGIPLAYLLGEREFWSLTLTVSPAVLIPRPATETLVATVLEEMNAPGQRVLELGTGSGAIALALASERSNWEVIATDVSEGALVIARANAMALAIHTVSFLLADWYQGINGAVQDARFDCIVSNPPYIANDDADLQAAVRDNEPTLALLAGADGLDAIRAIVSGASNHLLDDGLLALEHGFAQGPAVRALLENAGFDKVKTLADLEGHPRVTVGRYAP